MSITGPRKQVEPIEVSSPATGTKIYAVIGEGEKLQLGYLLAPSQYELALLP